MNSFRVAQEALKKKYISSHSEAGEVPEPSRKKKVKSYEKGDRKPSWQGEARGCELCKAMEMPERKYRSHSTEKCKQKEQWKTTLSENTADWQEAIAHRKKDWKDFAKSETRRADKAKEQLKELRSLIKDGKSSKKREYRVQQQGKKRKCYSKEGKKPEYSSDSEYFESSSSDHDDF